MNANGRRMIEEGVAAVPLIGPKQEVKLRHVMQDGPTSVPVVISGLVPLPDGVQALVSFGGLHKVEALAGQIAGHLVASTVCNAPGLVQSMPLVSSVACNALNLAEEILRQFKRRQEEATA